MFPVPETMILTETQNGSDPGLVCKFFATSVACLLEVAITTRELTDISDAIALETESLTQARQHTQTVSTCPKSSFACYQKDLTSLRVAVTMRHFRCCHGGHRRTHLNKATSHTGFPRLDALSLNKGVISERPVAAQRRSIR